MFACIRVCVCVYVRVFVCVSACIYIRVCVLPGVYTHVVHVYIVTSCISYACMGNTCQY